MDLKDFTGKSCSSRTAYEFIPSRKLQLGLAGVAERLRSAGFDVQVETPHLIVLAAGGKDVSVFRSGKILVKQTGREAEARKIAAGIAEKLG